MLPCCQKLLLWCWRWHSCLS